MFILTASLGFASVTNARSGQGILEINAGLSAALKLSCYKPLTFGVWFLLSGSRDSSTEVRVKPNVPGDSPITTKLAGDGSRGFPSPGQGECSVSGSLAEDGAELAVTFGETSIDLQPEAALFQREPSSDGGLTVRNFTFRPAASDSSFPAEMSKPKLSNGETTFAVGGLLVIPSTLTNDHFGGYTGTLTITVTDNL